MKIIAMRVAIPLASLCLLFSFTTFGQSRSLYYYLEQGSNNSPVLLDYKNKLLLANKDSILLSARRKPLIEAITQFMYAPVYNGYGYDEIVTDGGNYSGQIRASQAVFTRKNYSSERERTGIEGKAASNSMELSAMGIKHEIINAYIEACSGFHLMKANEDMLELMEHQDEWMRQMIGRGILTHASYMSFRMELQGMLMQCREDRIQYRNKSGTLNGLCGITDTSLYQLEIPVIENEKQNPEKENPFIRQFYIDSLRITNSRSLISNAYRPSLNWVADAGFLTSRPEYLNKNFGFSVGMNFSMPLYDGHQRKISYDKLAIEENTRAHYQQYFVSQRAMEVSRLQAELSEIRVSITAGQQLVDEALSMINMARELLNTGNMSLTDYILILKNFKALKATLTHSTFRSLQLMNDLNYLQW